MSMEILSIGQTIEEESPKKDAIHIAVAPVRASEHFSPGTHVELVPGTDLARTGTNTIGVVDPFLNTPIEPGERFWLFLYPNSIVSLRHEWTHPAFLSRNTSVEWLTSAAEKVNMSYEELVRTAKNWIILGEQSYLGYETPDIFYDENDLFWAHFECVTELRPSLRAKRVFFRCSC